MASRTEFVRIQASSNLGDVAARDAGQVALLRRSLGDLDGTNIATARSTETVTQQVDRQGSAFRRNTASIDQFSGRLRLLSEAAVIGGPALVAMGTVGGVAVAGLASAMGFAAVGAGTLAAGFSGVFDTLDLLNKAQLEPTEANLEALRQSMQQLSPDARQMVRDLDSLGPVLKELRDASAEGMAPEVERAVDNLIEGLPRLRGLFEETANATAGVLADGAGILTSDRWQPFLNFLEREAPRAIESLGGSAGDLAHGFAEVWRAMDPLNDDVLDLIERGADGFDKWASGLKGSEDMKEFISYVRENAPLVGEAVASIAEAVVDIAQAGAPLAGPVLKGITGIAEGVSAVAESDFGGPFAQALATLLLVNRALKVTAGLAGAVGGASLLGAGRGGKMSPVSTIGAAGAAGAVAGAGGGTTKTGKPAGPGAAAALSAVAIAPSAIEYVQDLTNGYDGLERSVGGVARALRNGNLPGEFDNIGESAALLNTRSRSTFLSLGDTLDKTFGMVPERVDEARTELGAFDDALAQVARKGGLGEAQKAFNQFADSLDLSGSERASVLNQLPQMGDKLSTFGGTAKDVSSDVRQLATDLFHVKPPKLNFDAAKPVEGAIKGITSALNGLDKTKARPTADLNDNPFAQNYGRVRRGVLDMDKAKATATANLNSDPFTGRRNQVMGALNVTDRFVANPTANLRDNASGPAASIRAAIAAIQSKTVTVTVNQVVNRIGNIGRAVAGAVGAGDEGMMLSAHPAGMVPVRRFAFGGLLDPTDIANAHVAEFANAGMTRVWREPETGGESYIPHADDHRRPRAMDILEQTAELFGGQVQWERLTQQRADRNNAARPAPGGRSAKQSVAVQFAGPAEVLVRQPDGTRQTVRLMAQIADERIDNWETSQKARYDT